MKKILFSLACLCIVANNAHTAARRFAVLAPMLARLNTKLASNWHSVSACTASLLALNTGSSAFVHTKPLDIGSAIYASRLASASALEQGRLLHINFIQSLEDEPWSQHPTQPLLVSSTYVAHNRAPLIMLFHDIANQRIPLNEQWKISYDALTETMHITRPSDPAISSGIFTIHKANGLFFEQLRHDWSLEKIADHPGVFILRKKCTPQENADYFAFFSTLMKFLYDLALSEKPEDEALIAENSRKLLSIKQTPDGSFCLHTENLDFINAFLGLAIIK